METAWIFEWECVVWTEVIYQTGNSGQRDTYCSTVYAWCKLRWFWAFVVTCTLGCIAIPTCCIITKHLTVKKFKLSQALLTYKEEPMWYFSLWFCGDFVFCYYQSTLSQFFPQSNYYVAVDMCTVYNRGHKKVYISFILNDSGILVLQIPFF